MLLPEYKMPGIAKRLIRTIVFLVHKGRHAGLKK